MLLGLLLGCSDKPVDTAVVEEVPCDTALFYADDDGDGVGGDEAVSACEAPADHVVDTGDCDDADAAVFPGAVEVCDEVDNDCDGDIDTDATDMATFYADSDGDGYGGSVTTLACSQPDGFAAIDGDCDDGDATANPGATEVCDGVDNNCDGEVDEGVTGTWYLDADGDGFGNASWSVEGCSQPSGFVVDDTDCDDLDSTASPAGTEVCDDADNDCDGTVDDEATDELVWYVDADGDGYGSADATTTACAQPTGYADSTDDCDDTTATTNPGAAQVCDSGVDGDCDGLVDCEDGDCFGVAACTEDCEDGTDNDADGLADCEDDDCFGVMDCARTVVSLDSGLFYVSMETWDRSGPWEELDAVLSARSMSGSLRSYSASGAVTGSCQWSLSLTRFTVDLVQSTIMVSLDAPERSGFAIDSGCNWSDSGFLSYGQYKGFGLPSPYGRQWLPIEFYGSDGTDWTSHVRYSGALLGSRTVTSSASSRYYRWATYSLSPVTFTLPE